jgi:succinate dehydrogenase / fumarate reductase cytochrome b subunit
MVYKYVDASPLNETRYFHELAEKFESPIRTGLYSLSFLLLSLHLWHGFSSSFSPWFNNKYSRSLKGFGYAAIVIPLGSFSLHYFIISIINIQL